MADFPKGKYLYILHSKDFDVDGVDTCYKFGMTEHITHRKFNSCYQTAMKYKPMYMYWYKIECDISLAFCESIVKRNLKQYRNINEQLQTHGTEMFCCSLKQLHEIVINSLNNHKLKYKEYTGDKFIKPNNIKVESLDDITKEPCKLFIKQQGAGNGKTYGIIQMINNPEKCQYTDIIIVTKQHSAKYQIYNEFITQSKNGILHNLQINEDYENNKKYIISYDNKLSRNKCQIIIATIDSLMFAIGNKNTKSVDKFEGIVNSIIVNDIEDTSLINFGGLNIILCPTTLLVIDETQDLPEPYAKAVIKIMENRYIDSYMVGDKLQSISYEKNAFGYLCNTEFTGINKINDIATNICRRFDDKELISFVNKIVPFQTKYNLPEITSPCTNKTFSKNTSIVPFNGNTIYSNDKNEAKIAVEVEKIMYQFDNEVIIFNRKPNDFLIITSFTTKNPLMNFLQIAINEYWQKKYNDENYKNYAIFHKSEEGSSIELDDSKDATRMVSIHASKGDGRPVVFLIGLSENGFRKFSIQTGNLIYESLLHVALTRMKQKLYIRMECRDDRLIRDDFNTRLSDYFKESTDYKIDPTVYCSHKFNYNNIYKINNEEYENLYDNIIVKTILPAIKQDNDKKQTIDMSHHNIRYYVMYINILIYIIKKENENKKEGRNESDKRQIMKVLFIIKPKKYISSENWLNYAKRIHNNVITKISYRKGENSKYSTIFTNFIDRILEKIPLFISGLYIPCPLECIILYYIIQIVNKGMKTDIHSNDIYDILHSYDKSFNLTIEGHENCLCKKKFKNNKSSENNKLELYLTGHYNKIKNINSIMSCIYKKFKKINWLINHHVSYTGFTNDFKVPNNFPLIGYSKKSIIIIYVKPQFNEINYNQIIVDTVFNTFLLLTSKDEKFVNKHIYNCIVTLDREEPYYIKWKPFTNEQHIIIKNIIIEKIKNYYYIVNKDILYLYDHCVKLYKKKEIKSMKEFVDKMIDYTKPIPSSTNKPNIIPKYITSFYNILHFTENLQTVLCNKNLFQKKLEESFNDSINSFLNGYDNDESIMTFE